MSGVLSLSVLALLGFCIITELGREVCFKYAAGRSPNVLRTLLMPVTWLGMLFWGLEMFGLMLVLEKVPLSTAFPLMALSYVTMALAGATLFDEKINIRHAIGIVLITAGVVCVGLTGL